MHHEPRRLLRLLLSQSNLGEDSVPITPRSLQTLKRRTVLGTCHSQPVVELGHVHRLGLGWWPRSELRQREGCIRRADRGRNVPGPCVGVVRLGEDGHRAVSGLISLADRYGQLHTAGLRQQERGFDHQLIDNVATDLAGGADDQLNKCGTGEQDIAPDRVISQPCMGGQRHPPGQQHTIGVRQLHRHTHQWMTLGRRPVHALEPVPLVLESVGRKVQHPGCGGTQHRRPVDTHALDIGLRQGSEHPDGVPVVTAQRGNRDRIVVHGLYQHRAGADLDEHGVALGLQL
ncbi:hypothetical protein J2Z30_009179, partial [Streptomyces iranensis]|nr:hypothetical protein [Streptomyces iranensis]